MREPIDLIIWVAFLPMIGLGLMCVWEVYCSVVRSEKRKKTKQ